MHELKLFSLLTSRFGPNPNGPVGSGGGGNLGGGDHHPHSHPHAQHGQHPHHHNSYATNPQALSQAAMVAATATATATAVALQQDRQQEMGQYGHSQVRNVRNNFWNYLVENRKLKEKCRLETVRELAVVTGLLVRFQSHVIFLLCRQVSCHVIKFVNRNKMARLGSAKGNMTFAVMGLRVEKLGMYEFTWVTFSDSNC